MVIIISRSFASQKVQEAAIEIIDRTDSSVSAVSIETGAGFQDCNVPVSSRSISPHFTVQLSRFLIEQISIYCHLPWNFPLKTSVKNPYLQCATEYTFSHY